MTEDKMIIELINTCAECGAADVVIELNTADGDIECTTCHIVGRLTSREVDDILMNLED
jgi:hypothetical protein